MRDRILSKTNAFTVHPIPSSLSPPMLAVFSGNRKFYSKRLHLVLVITPWRGLLYIEMAIGQQCIAFLTIAKGLDLNFSHHQKHIIV